MHNSCVVMYSIMHYICHLKYEKTKQKRQLKKPSEASANA